MLPAAAIPVIMSAIPALLQYRQKMDEIVSLNQATATLPFLLPPTSLDYSNVETCDAVIAYFKPPSDEHATDFGPGYGVLQANEYEAKYERFKKLYKPHNIPVEYPRGEDSNLIYKLWCQSTGTKLKHVGPDSGDENADASYPVINPEMQLAYYMVKSVRLSKNNVWARLALATADTLMEVAGANAGLFLKDPKLKPIFETLFHQFSAVDFDDYGVEALFKRLLGSAIIAAGQNADKLGKNPALSSLSRAFLELGTDDRFQPEDGDTADIRNKKLRRKAQIKDLAAYVITAEGFSDLVSVSLNEISQDGLVHTDSDYLNTIIKATLEEVVVATDYRNFDHLRSNPIALLGILEAGIHAAALNAPAVLEKRYGDLPQGKLLMAVTSAALDEVAQAAQQHQFIHQLQHGQLLPAIVRTSLTAVADNPDLISGAADVKDIVGEVTAMIAGGLAEINADTRPVDFLNDFLKKMAATVAEQPKLLGIKDPFAVKVLTATLSASSKFNASEIKTDDIIRIAQAALGAASSNLALSGLGSKYAFILKDVGSVIASESADRLKTSAGWQDAMLASIEAISANPRLWELLSAGDLLQQTVQAVIAGLKEDPSNLISEETFVSCLRRVLRVLSKHGQMILDDRVDHPTLQSFLSKALARADDELGKTMDRENLPEFLQRCLAAYFHEPFQMNQSAKLNALLDTQLKVVANLS